MVQQGTLPSFWSGQAPSLKPFLRLEINQFKHSAAEILNIRARVSKLIVHIDGLCFVRLSPLLTVLGNISTQAKNVFFSKSAREVSPEEHMHEETAHMDGHVNRHSDVNPSKKVNVCFKDFQIDMFLERIPELVSTYTNDLAAKTFSMVFVERFFIPIKFPEFNTAKATVGHPTEDDHDVMVEGRPTQTDLHPNNMDGVKSAEQGHSNNTKSKPRHPATLTDRIREHYQSQIMSNAYSILANTKLLDGTTALYSSVNQKWLEFFKSPSSEGGKSSMSSLNSHQSKKAFRESIYTAFRAHTHAVGAQGTAARQPDSKSWLNTTWNPNRLLQTLYSIPFAARWVPGRRQMEESGEVSRQLISERKPHRIPRFFFKNAILIPYSSLKARLQMVVDNKDIVEGTFYFITPDDVILLAPEKMYIVSRNPQHEVFILQIDQIFKVAFEEPQTPLKQPTELSESDEILSMLSIPTLRQEGLGAFSLTINYYDKRKFEKNVSGPADPFAKADKCLRLEFFGVNQKVKKEFEARITHEKENNFVAFF